jgi:D-3-phosphoglycerate dehydrogenase
VLTPHIGGATEETVERHSAMMAKAVMQFLAGVRPEHLVNPEAWAAYE